MPLYESVFIARQDIPAQEVEALADRFAAVVAEQGGAVARREYWGLKNMAYRIKKNRKGHYTMLHIDAPPGAVLEMERTMRINEDVLRYMSIRLDELPTEPSIMMQTRAAREDRRRDERRRARRRDDDRRDAGRPAAGRKPDAAAAPAAEAKPAAVPAEQPPAAAPETGAAEAPADSAPPPAPAAGGEAKTDEAPADAAPGGAAKTDETPADATPSAPSEDGAAAEPPEPEEKPAP